MSYSQLFIRVGNAKHDLYFGHVYLFMCNILPQIIDVCKEQAARTTSNVAKWSDQDNFITDQWQLIELWIFWDNNKNIIIIHCGIAVNICHVFKTWTEGTLASFSLSYLKKGVWVTLKELASLEQVLFCFNCIQTVIDIHSRFLCLHSHKNSAFKFEANLPQLCQKFSSLEHYREEDFKI